MNGIGRRWAVGLRLAAAVAAAALLCGCADKVPREQAFDLSENLVYVTSEGAIFGSSVERFDHGPGDYRQSELEEDLKAALSAYNAARKAPLRSVNEDGQEKLPAAFVSCELADGAAMAVIEYASGQELIRLAEENEDPAVSFTSLISTTVDDALSRGLLADGRFIKAGKGKAASLKEISRKGKLRVVAAEGGGRIRTEGKVRYITEGCSQLDDHTVMTPQEGRSYILFK